MKQYSDASNFVDSVYSAFCKYVGVSSESKNVEIKEKTQFEKNKQIFIYQLLLKSIIITAPSFFSELRGALMNDKRRVTATNIKNILNLKELEMQDKYHFFYLDPSNFVFSPSRKRFSIRVLSSKDEEIFNKFEDRCSDEDKQAGTVSLRDPVVFGCIYGGEIIAAASYSFWGELLADVAVLTHPEFRRKGIGKAVLSALCRWGIQNNRISQYCCSGNNFASINLAISLKFEKLIKLERLILKDPNNLVN